MTTATANVRKPPTKKQREVYDYIVSFRESKGYSPSFREISAHMGFAAPVGAMCHLHALRKKGWITWEEQCSRTIMPIGGEA